MTKANPRFDMLYFLQKYFISLFFYFVPFLLLLLQSPVGGKDFTNAVASFLYCRDMSYNNEGHLHMSLVVHVQAGAAAGTLVAYFATSPTCATRRRLVSDCFVLLASPTPGIKKRERIKVYANNAGRIVRKVF